MKIFLNEQSIQTLKKYSTIAIDYDGTLVDGPASELLHKFILDNPDKTYYIVTFRSGALAKNIIGKMNQKYPNSPTADYFKGVHHMSERMVQAFQMDTLDRVKGMVGGPDTKAEERYKTWKGKVCRSIGAQALVDDDTAMVIQGLTRYKVDHVDPEHLTEFNNSYDTLNEGRDAPLYHGTELKNALAILRSGNIDLGKLVVKGRKFISLTRRNDLWYGDDEKGFGDVVFTLDQRRMAHNYKFDKVDYYGSQEYRKDIAVLNIPDDEISSEERRNRGSEAEERVYKPIPLKYVTAIGIRSDVYQHIETGRFSEEQLDDIIRSIRKIANQRNIPVRFLDVPEDFDWKVDYD